MLMLTYNLASDEFQNVSVIGDEKGIYNLYWQLTHNYSAKDGLKIGQIMVSDLVGNEIVMNKSFVEICSLGTALSQNL
jgi:hypothetical protein